MQHTRMSGRPPWRAFAGSRAAAGVAFGWGLAEATLFFVVPDVWIGLLALCGWRAGVRAAAWAVVGAVIGGLVMYGVGAAVEPERSARLLDAVPAISGPMIERVEEETRRRGAGAMVTGPPRGMPYKIYARTAGVQGGSLPAMLLWTVPARSVRFLLVAGAAALGGRLAGRWLPAGRVVPLYLLVWVVFYVGYFGVQGF